MSMGMGDTSAKIITRYGGKPVAVVVCHCDSGNRPAEALIDRMIALLVSAREHCPKALRAKIDCQLKEEV